MTIEVGRFPDKRLKVIRKFMKSDSNVRVKENVISVVSRINEVELENDTIEAVNLWNMMQLFPDFKREIQHIMKRYLLD